MSFDTVPFRHGTNAFGFRVPGRIAYQNAGSPFPEAEHGNQISPTHPCRRAFRLLFAFSPCRKARRPVPRRPAGSGLVGAWGGRLAGPVMLRQQEAASSGPCPIRRRPSLHERCCDRIRRVPVPQRPGARDDRAGRMSLARGSLSFDSQALDGRRRDWCSAIRPR